MKSVCDFLVVLLVGMILGGVLVLAWYKIYLESFSLSDLGALLAGLFTMFLFLLAWLGKGEWKRQQDRQLQRVSLNHLYSSLTQYFHDQKLTMFELENHSRAESSDMVSNCGKCHQLVEKVMLSASQCDPDIAVFDSISSVKIPYELTPDFSYKKLNNRMDLENFKMHEWKEIIEEHECSSKKALNSLNEAISRN